MSVHFTHLEGATGQKAASYYTVNLMEMQALQIRGKAADVFKSIRSSRIKLFKRGK